MAFSQELVADLAATFPDSAGLLENHGSWQGPIERWVYDSADLKSSRTVTKMKIGDRFLEVHFANPEDSNVANGSLLQAEGVQIGNKVVLNAAAVEGVAATAANCSTKGAQKTAVFLVTWPGATVPSTVTPQSVHDIFFGTTGRSLDALWREASYGQTSATGDV